MRCRWCGRTLCLAVAVPLAALLVGVCYGASLRVQRPYARFPSPEQLAADTRGRYFGPRPSDGGALEYFVYGSQEATAHVWLLVHGALSTGGMFEIFPEFDARMKALNVRVVAPTMPGWGASDAYGPLFEVSGAQWLERWSRDVMALMDHLGVERFAVSGLSLGGTPGIAAAAAAQRRGRRLVALAPLIALMWSHPGFNLAAVGGYSASQRVLMCAVRNRYLGSLAAEVMRWAVLRTGANRWEANPMLPPDVQWDRVLWGRDMQRAVRYQLAGQVQSNRLPGFESAPLFDWGVFDEAVPVYVFYGERDDVVPPAVATYTATQLPWAELRPFNGTHFHLDIFEVAATFFPQQHE